MRRLLLLLASAGAFATLFSCSTARQAEVASDDLMSDTWVATDALGRQMPLIDSVGPVKTDHERVVGIFYITWHSQNKFNRPGPYTDVTQILREDPSARFQNDNPLWKYGEYHWGEPEMGYFLSQDEWVIRKDISMLQDAGVDVLVMDVTNGVCYWDEWEVLFSTMMKMRQEGNRTPEFVFWSYNNKPVNVVKQLYERYYKENKFSDLWFYWDGKPLLLFNANPGKDANGQYKVSIDDYPREIFDFFTLRNMWWGFYKEHDVRYIGTEDYWSFGYSMGDPNIIHMTPEELVSKHDGKPEEAAVTPAQHPVRLGDNTVPIGVGKSWSRESRHARRSLCALARQEGGASGRLRHLLPGTLGGCPGRRSALHLPERLERVDGRHVGPRREVGIPAPPGESLRLHRPVQCRVQPDKGVRPIPENKGFGKVTVDGDFSDWSAVDVVYRDTRGDVTRRDAKGYAGLHYRDSSGRNDIQDAKVAVTKDGQVCFYVKAGSDITPSTDPNWMLLLVDIDQDASTGWYGYDILINKEMVDGQTSRVLQYADGAWKPVGEAAFQVRGNELELSVPAGLLRVSGNQAAFDFKWADNPYELKDPISLCLHGDTAPNRRFNFRFLWKK